MKNYTLATIGALAAMNTAQVRAAEQVVLNNSIDDTDTLEYVVSYEALMFPNEFIHSPNCRTPITQPAKQEFKVPYKLEKGNATTLCHPGREHAMRLYGKDNRT